MKKQYVIVEHRSSAALDALRTNLRKLDDDYRALLQRFKQLEIRYSEEVYLNSELIDLLKLHGISFRPALDHLTRYPR